MNNIISKIASILILITFISNFSNAVSAQTQEVSTCANETIALFGTPITESCLGTNSALPNWYINGELVCQDCLHFDFASSEIGTIEITTTTTLNCQPFGNSDYCGVGQTTSYGSGSVPGPTPATPASTLYTESTTFLVTIEDCSVEANTSSSDTDVVIPTSTTDGVAIISNTPVIRTSNTTSSTFTNATNANPPKGNQMAASVQVGTSNTSSSNTDVVTQTSTTNGVAIISNTPVIGTSNTTSSTFTNATNANPPKGNQTAAPVQVESGTVTPTTGPEINIDVVNDTPKSDQIVNTSTPEETFPGMFDPRTPVISNGGTKGRPAPSVDQLANNLTNAINIAITEAGITNNDLDKIEVSIDIKIQVIQKGSETNPLDCAIPVMPE